jgi:hypothetical protein
MAIRAGSEQEGPKIRRFFLNACLIGRSSLPPSGANFLLNKIFLNFRSSCFLSRLVAHANRFKHNAVNRSTTKCRIADIRRRWVGSVDIVNVDAHAQTRMPYVDDPTPDIQAFAQLKQVLRGELRVPLDGTSSKMLRQMCDHHATIAIITSEKFVGYSERSRQRIIRRVSPRAISALLERAKIDVPVERPLVIGLPEDIVVCTDGFPEWSYKSKLVWLVPGEDAVKIAVRDSVERWVVAFHQDVPLDGPLALPLDERLALSAPMW